VQKTLDDVLQAVSAFDCNHVVITGGEPFLQTELTGLVESLKAIGKFVTIETNGTIFFPTKAEFISLSPKLKSSCVDSSKYFKEHDKLRINLDALTQFIQNHSVQLKFVVNEASDIDEIKNIIYELENRTQKTLKEKVYLMPQALTKDDLDINSLQVIEWAKSNGWNFTDRLHIRIWGPKRGV
jgi:7-carboxy-7-deazaguanine synthase